GGVGDGRLDVPVRNELPESSPGDSTGCRPAGCSIKIAGTGGTVLFSPFPLQGEPNPGYPASPGPCVCVIGGSSAGEPFSLFRQMAAEGRRPNAGEAPAGTGASRGRGGESVA